jgi:hypothetical protein
VLPQTVQDWWVEVGVVIHSTLGTGLLPLRSSLDPTYLFVFVQVNVITLQQDKPEMNM